MSDKPTLVLWDSRSARHSINALLGALEAAPDMAGLEISAVADLDAVTGVVEAYCAAGARPVVGMSFMSNQADEMAAWMRKRAGHVGEPRSVVWLAGGPHPAGNPQAALAMGFDAVALGEGESVLAAVLSAVANKTALDSVAGLAVAGATSQLRPAPPIDLDDYPPFPTKRWRRVGPIEISRGCPFGCGYCQTTALFGCRPRHRSVEQVSHYAAIIREKGPCDVRMISPDAFAYGSADGKQLNLDALAALLGGVRVVLGNEGRLFFGTFPSEVRPEHVSAEALSLVRRYAHNDYLVIGGQSGSDRLLAHCRRGHTVADIISAVEATRQAALEPRVDFIFGLPGETEDDVRETIRVMDQLAAAGALIHAHTFMPLAGTRFAEEPAGRLSGGLRLAMKRLIRSGRLYGVWHRQGDNPGARTKGGKRL